MQGCEGDNSLPRRPSFSLPASSSVGEHSSPTLAIGNNCGGGAPGNGVQHRSARIAPAAGKLAGKLFTQDEDARLTKHHGIVSEEGVGEVL